MNKRREMKLKKKVFAVSFLSSLFPFPLSPSITADQLNFYNSFKTGRHMETSEPLPSLQVLITNTMASDPGKITLNLMRLRWGC